MKPYRPPVYAPTGGIPSFEDQEDDPRALWNSVHVGDPLGMASPSEDMAMKRLLGEHAVERTRRERAAADADGQTSIATQIERGRSDAASDPRYGGFASQWSPFFEALRGSKVKVGSLDLPSSDSFETFRDNPTDPELDRLRRRATGGSQSIASLQRGR